jgi:DNA polymerase-3 subunit gamma/tau
MQQEMKGMSARVKNMTLRITDYPNIEVVVDNQILLDEIQRIKGRVRATLAQKLHNGNIEVTYRLAEIEEVGKILTRKELFDKMRNENPAIEKLRILMNLEMA